MLVQCQRSAVLVQYSVSTVQFIAIHFSTVQSNALQCYYSAISVQFQGSAVQSNHSTISTL